MALVSTLPDPAVFGCNLAPADNIIHSCDAPVWNARGGADAMGVAWKGPGVKINMFEWLDEQILTVQTPKFFVIDGPADAQFRSEVESESLPISETYREFAMRFGTAKLYRQDRDRWDVVVFGTPRLATSPDGVNYLQFGRARMSLAYFGWDVLNYGHDSPIFEWRYPGVMLRTFDTFEEWLECKCRASRRRFKKPAWTRIEEGPSPLSDRELAVVDARARYRFRTVGVAPNGHVLIEIENHSTMRLPYLTVGLTGLLRSDPSEILTGGLCLPVSHIAPGSTEIVSKESYFKLVEPQTVKVFEVPHPGPEDREYYWEFRED